MQEASYELKKYTADKGHVFDWVEPRYQVNENGEEEQIHLYCTVLWIGHTDSIENYKEVIKPTE